MAKTVGFLLCLTHACLAGGATSPTSAPASAPADVVAREFLSQSLGNNGVLKRRALKELYLDVVSRGLKEFECNPTRRRWEDIVESLQLRFQELSQVTDQLTESQRRGYIGWLAWCTVQAAREKPVSASELQVIRQECIDLFGEALQKGEEALLSPPKIVLSERSKQQIRDAVADCMARFERRVALLQRDALYPSLRTRLNAKQKTVLLRVVSNPENYSVLHATRGTQQKREESFVAGAKGVVSNIDDSALFFLCAKGIEPELLGTRWVRFKSLTATGEDNSWSIVYYLDPVLSGEK